MSASSLPLMLTIQRAVEETGIPRSSLYVLAGRGDIDIKKSGRRSLILGSSLARYIASLPPAPIRKVA